MAAIEKYIELWEIRLGQYGIPHLRPRVWWMHTLKHAITDSEVRI